MRVVIAEGHQLLRVGLRAVLEKQGDIRVVGEVSSSQAALSLVLMEQPDVALIADDLGLASVPALLGAVPGLRLLLLSAREDTEVVGRAFAAGVHGYLSKAAHPDELIQAVRSLAAGRAFLSATLGQPARRAPLATAREKSTSPSQYPPKVARPLSGRERQVLELFAQGHTHRQIADILGVRAKTVETYRSRLGDKFGVRSRAELLYSAREMGLLGEGATSSAG